MNKISDWKGKMYKYGKDGIYKGSKLVVPALIKATGHIVCDDEDYYRIIGKPRSLFPAVLVRPQSWVKDSGWDINTKAPFEAILQVSKVKSSTVLPNKSEVKPKIVIVDGNNVLYRSYFAMPGLMTKTGIPTGAIKGFVNQIHWLQESFKDALLVFTFDSPGPSTRHTFYPEYKAGRKKDKEDDLQPQIEPIKRIIRAFGYPLFAQSGIEADDIIATLARIHSANYGVILATSDKDLAQLVNKRVRMYDLRNRKMMDSDGVKEKWGVGPDQIKEYLMLLGDSVDNIPGVDKCGPKTAVKWLESYGSIDGIIQASGEIKGVVGENLRNSISQFPLTEDLVRLHHIDMDTTLNFKPLNREKLRVAFKKFELNFPWFDGGKGSLF